MRVLLLLSFPSLHGRHFLLRNFSYQTPREEEKVREKKTFQLVRCEKSFRKSLRKGEMQHYREKLLDDLEIFLEILFDDVSNLRVFKGSVLVLRDWIFWS